MGEMKLKEPVIRVVVDDCGSGFVGRRLVWELWVDLCFRMGGNHQPGGLVMFFLEIKTIVWRRRIVYGGFLVGEEVEDGFCGRGFCGYEEEGRVMGI